MTAEAMSPERIQQALRRAWFPVARVADLDQPRQATLLGEELVVFRTAGGQPAVASNRCPHRGAALALGRVNGESIACPYHGWEWGAGDGVCTRIPSLGPGERMPAKAMVRTYPAREKWELVWTCLGAPAVELPTALEMEELEWESFTGEPLSVNVGIAAMTENYRDLAHFPFVHEGTLGKTPEVVSPLEVRREGIEVWLDYVFSAQGGPLASIWESQGNVLFRYHTIAPAFICLVMDYGPRGKRVGLNIPAPVSLEECLIYWVEAMTPGFPGTTLEECVESARAIYIEDLRVLNSLRPREVSFDRGRPELSVPADRYTLAYRRAFTEYVKLATPARRARVDVPAASGGDGRRQS